MFIKIISSAGIKYNWFEDVLAPSLLLSFMFIKLSRYVLDVCAI